LHQQLDEALAAASSSLIRMARENGPVTTTLTGVTACPSDSSHQNCRDRQWQRVAVGESFVGFAIRKNCSLLRPSRMSWHIIC
jgi:hypothetical protein